MAWNRPSDKQIDLTLKPKKPRWLLGVCILVALVIGAGLYFVFSYDEDEVRKTKVAQSHKIAQVTPKVNRNPSTNSVSTVTEKERPPQRFGEVRDGMVLFPDGKLRSIKNAVTNYSGLAKMDYEIFTHASENIIAGLLSIEPGRGLVGTPVYNGRFTKDFLESLTEPIIATQDDSEHDRNLKKAVTQAKIELKAAYDRGEDIEKIIIDERKNLQKLGMFKQELQAMTMREIKNAASAEEMDDFITAANKILEEKGIAPLDPSPLSKIKLRLLQQKEGEK